MVSTEWRMVRSCVQVSSHLQLWLPGFAPEVAATLGCNR